MLERFARRVAAFSVEKPGLVVALFTVLFVVAGYGASRLGMRLNYMELLPESDEAVVDLRYVMKKAGSEGYLVTSVSGGSREDRLAFADAWTNVQAAMPELRYAEYKYDIAFFKTHATSLLPLETLKTLESELDKRIQAGVSKKMDLGLDDDAPASTPVDSKELEDAIKKYEADAPKELIEDDDKSTLFTLAKPAVEASDIGAIQKTLARAEEEAAKLKGSSPRYAPLQIAFGGPMVFQKRFDQGIRGDLGNISLLAIVLATGFLLLATRRPLASIAILIPITIAISVTLALAALTIGHLTIISGTLVAVLLGLGVEFGIHLVLRTSEARAHMPMKDALLEAVPETMEGAFSGAITNGAAFFVLVFCQFGAFREFGVIAAMGVVLSWLFTYALLPALLLLLERVRPGWALRAATTSTKPLLIPRGAVLAVAVIVPLFSLYGAWSIKDIRVERSFVALHGKEHPDPIGVRAAKAMNTTLTPVVAWVPTIADAKRFEKIVEEVRLADKHPLGPSISGSVSLGRVVHDDWPEREKVLAHIRQLIKRIPADAREKLKTRIQELETALDAPRVGADDIPPAFTRKLKALDNEGTFVLIGHARSVDDAEELDAFVARVDEALMKAKASGINVRAMSENRVAVRIFRQVFADAPFIAWAATLVALITLFGLLRSLRETLIVFTPIALGMLMMVAGMKLYGVKLNFINMAVIPSIFTVAIDNTVHLYHRYREEGRGMMPLILRNTGAAVLIATCVNASGYGPTLMCKFYALKSLGVIASFGMIGMLLATVVWFPALLILLPERPAKH